MSDVVLIETVGAVRRITMNRPAKMNAMNAELVEAMISAITDADQDENIAVIILAGAGRAFSAGADMSKHTGSPPSAREMQAAANRGLRFYTCLIETDTPLIAQVHGYALGGGCNAAVSSDLVVAAKSAIFGYPEVRVGLAATSVSPPIVHQIGRKAAFELLTLCENISADRALELGMINRVVPDDELAERAMEMAQKLASFDHDALWMTKQTIRRAAALPLRAALEMTRDQGLGMKIFDR
ncbi:MAG: enoyl-CoA hydratase/carnithine racemase [Gammaproteobacteria bacterium]|jgi:enoyl-CoA hydratase/carnithine racemase